MANEQGRLKLCLHCVAYLVHPFLSPRFPPQKHGETGKFVRKDVDFQHLQLNMVVIMLQKEVHSYLVGAITTMLTHPL